MFNMLKIVQNSKKFKDGSVLFSMGCLDILYDFEYIVRMLNASQNEEDHYVASLLAQS